MRGVLLARPNYGAHGCAPGRKPGDTGHKKCIMHFQMARSRPPAARPHRCSDNRPAEVWVAAGGQLRRAPASRSHLMAWIMFRTPDAGLVIARFLLESVLPMARQVSAHVPVLANEVLHWLAPASGKTFADGTLGGGGHTRLLAERVGAEGLVVAVDRDPQAIAQASASLAGLPIKVAQANYCELPAILHSLGITRVDGMVLDLGLSSDQLADEARGFSYEAEGDLDLRFDPDRGEPAWRLVARLSAEHLARILYEFGEERFSRRIARRIVQQRRERPIRSARDLAKLVRSCVPRSKNHRIDPATRTFQALRIAVNEELASLESALARLPDCLASGGRFAVISFHSLEDRLVKKAFRDDPRWKPLTGKPVRPTDEELERNRRSRSARLRVAERLEQAEPRDRQAGSPSHGTAS